MRHRCGRCGRAIECGDLDPRLTFHRCTGGPPPPLHERSTRSLLTREESLRSVWLDAFARAVDDEELLRKVEP